MPITASLLPEFDHEMATTRRVLERVPDTDFAWKPHDKSMSLGQLAGHLANILTWCTAVTERPFVDVETAPEAGRPADPASRAELLAEFDAKVTTARASLAGRTDAEMMTPWTLRQGEKEIFTLPRISAIRSFIMNHSIHHRGQLSVYLRLRNVAVPSIYGPSADEQ